MPCRYDGPDDSSVCRGELDTVTQIACEALTLLDDNGLAIPKCAVKWWKEHRARHIKRKQEEKVAKEQKRKRKEALAKLTKEDQKALGLR